MSAIVALLILSTTIMASGILNDLMTIQLDGKAQDEVFEEKEYENNEGDRSDLENVLVVPDETKNTIVDKSAANSSEDVLSVYVVEDNSKEEDMPYAYEINYVEKTAIDNLESPPNDNDTLESGRQENIVPSPSPATPPTPLPDYGLVADAREIDTTDNSYKEPDTPSPEPTLVKASKKAPSTAITSNTPMYWKTPEMSDFAVPDSGSASFQWSSDMTASLDATYKIGRDTYTVVCVSVSQVSEEGYYGTFEINKNGMVLDSVEGSVCAVIESGGANSYFKFYAEGEEWHFSGKIANMTVT